MRDHEALPCRDVEKLFGVLAIRARSMLKRHVAQGDPCPLKIRGTWLAPLGWWKGVLGLTDRASGEADSCGRDAIGADAEA